MQLIRTVSLFLLFSIGAAGYVSAKIISIPFKLRDDHIFIKLFNNEGHAYDFIFDTGAEGTIFDVNTANKHGIEAKKVTEVITANGKSKLGYASKQYLKIDRDTELRKLHFILHDLSHLNADGVIGYDILNRFTVKIDYINKQLIITSRLRDFDLTSFKPIAFKFDKAAIPVINATIVLASGENLTSSVLVDTGAGLTIMIGNQFFEEHDLKTKFPKVLTSSSHGLSKRSETKISRIAAFKINSFELDEMPVRISTNNTGVFSDREGYLGILGNVILSRFDIVLDYRSKQIYLKENANYNNSFEFPTRGFKLKRHSNDVLISSIIMESEAYEAGLSQGDRVVSINGNDSNDIATYNKILKKNQSGIIIVVSSALTGDLLETDLKNRDIFDSN
ncbi:MAG: aspartyl protease family protein [Bacteroidota bacterium]